LKLSHAAMKQAIESAGLIVGRTVFEPPKRFWTITLWQDPKSMRRFVGSGPLSFSGDWYMLNTVIPTRSLPGLDYPRLCKTTMLAL